MNTIKKLLVLAALVTAAVAQSSEPPLGEKRLTIHTLVREDIFAGFLANDTTRLARGERNVDLLLEQRPDAKADLLAWKAGATLYRAVAALENKNQAEFAKKYKQATGLFAQAREAGPRSGGVYAVTGGSFVLFADRLPEEHRAAAWGQVWDSYNVLWKQQGAMIDKLPVHLRGEVLAGLTMSAQRTGRKEEMAKYLDRTLELMAGTPYEAAAKKWKADPAAMATTSLACMNCHDDGRLSARLTAINK
ncbi:MAG: hypothetical protein ACKV2V_27655 [Blastocatellia bacterium]